MAVVAADGRKIEVVGEQILRYLAQKETEVMYAMLGCCYALSKLSCNFEDLTDEQQQKFVQDLTSWLDAYWGEGPGKPLN